MATKNIYGIKTTIFDGDEIENSYLNIGIYTSLKKAYKAMQLTAEVFKATIYNKNARDMHIHYISEQGKRVMQTIERYLLC